MFDVSSKYAGQPHREVGDIERRVANYLADAARDGPIYVTSKRAAKDLGLTTTRAGQAIALLGEESATLKITRWSSEGSTPTTWHVGHDGPAPYGRDCQVCGSLLPEAADACPHCGQGVLG